MKHYLAVKQPVTWNKKVAFSVSYGPGSLVCISILLLKTVGLHTISEDLTQYFL